MSYATVLLTFIKDEKKIPMVYEPTKPEPILWKFPSGGEDPEDYGVQEVTACRESRQECGVAPEPEELEFIDEERKRPRGRPEYMKYYYAGQVSNSNGLLERGDEGEIVKLFTVDEIEKMIEEGKVLQDHAKLFRKLQRQGWFPA